LESDKHQYPDRLAGCPDLSKRSHSFRREGNGSGPAVGWMRVPVDQSALLMKDEHRPHGTVIRGHAASKCPLGASVSPGEGSKEDELVSGAAVRRESCLAPAV
jgi:hypothetical protein